MSSPGPAGAGIWQALATWCATNPLILGLLTALLLLAGATVAPFDLPLGGLPRDPIPVDALPDTGDNQQIVFTEWAGRSPRDVEDQITYPLTTALLGVPGVQTVRSSSALGFSSIYVIFDDSTEFYWARSRVLEKLASLPAGTLPPDVRPTLGPDATAVGQVYWYTLQGRSPDGQIVGGWDPDELRSIQDWTVRWALQAAEGVSEVASIGGFVREYQIDVDPDALRAHDVTLAQVAGAVRRSNLDVGARTLEINQVEYVVRGKGFVDGVGDLEQTVVASRGATPIRVRDVARVGLGPALRRGALDDAGAPAVGGVVVARHLANPLAVIGAVEQQIARIQPGLPRRVLEDGTVSQVTIVPFYDRTELIHDTLDTLSEALLQQLLIAGIVVLVLLRDVRSAALIGLTLPLGVLGAFVAMKLAGVGANLMALGGIAIAIGTMVDVGIVFVENMRQHLDEAPPDEPRHATIARATAEVAPAVSTSVLTTVVGFLPVFGLTAAELKLFAPLAWTKTFAMLAALGIAGALLPAAAVYVLRPARQATPSAARALRVALVVALGLALVQAWMPLGEQRGWLANAVVVAALLGGVLALFSLFERAYPALLRTFLAHRAAFLAAPLGLVALGGAAFSDLGREYMPPFDEGAFLYMPTTMPHASIGEAHRLLSQLDAAIAQIPEVDRVVGKIGRVDSALDPAPVSMIETVITYHPEYGLDADGRRVRQWRDHIDGPDAIWHEITRAAQIPGLTGAPLLMPINARLVMLQSGMRAPMGVKVSGPDLDAIEGFGLQLEDLLRRVPEVRAEAVFADRVVGKPYLEIAIDREAIGRHGLVIDDVQQALQIAVGGVTLTQTVEGRERYPVRVRYAREDRDTVEAIERLLIATPSGAQVPLVQLARLEYVRGPQMIRAEDTFLTSYVLFDRAAGVPEVTAVHAAQRAIEGALARGELSLPDGVSYAFAGSYEAQVRSERRLMVLIPVALLLVLILLHLQFKRLSTTLAIGSGALVAASGGFGLLWLYGVPGFLDVTLLGVSLAELLQVGPIHLSVAAWVGVIALLGVAVDDGVVLSTYLRQRLDSAPPTTVAEVRERVLEAGVRRVRPCLMTTATTLLALLPVITSPGRGADVMLPMALPLLGGMFVALLTLFVVPVLSCAVEERRVAAMAAAPASR